MVAALRSLCINGYVFFWIGSVGKTGLVFVSPSKGKDWFRSWKCYCCLQILFQLPKLLPSIQNLLSRCLWRSCQSLLTLGDDSLHFGG